jgi:arylsulfatase A-like enzyme
MAIIGSLVLLASLTAFCAVESARPNIILIMTDDQGWGETGYYDHPYVKTPVLDEMARSGLRFDRFYSASAVCSPTRASVMTGRNPNRSGTLWFNYSLRPQEITLPQILREAGYRTGHFGKWHLGAVKDESPVNPGRLGYDEYLAHDNFFDIDPVFSRNGAEPQQFKGESSKILVDEALGFIRKVHQEENPFFTTVWFGSPHGPYRASVEDIALYKEVPSAELRARLGEITAMDRAVGTLRNGLKELGVADNTLIWFNSDNGIPRDFIGKKGNDDAGLNGHLHGTKASLYEGGIRVPAMIEWPAVIRKSRIIDLPAVTSDIFPTVLDILGLTSSCSNRPLDGISLRPLIEGRAMDSRPKPIGIWNYSQTDEPKNGDWLNPDIQRGTIKTSNNKIIQFLNYKHPVVATGNFRGEAAWVDGHYKLLLLRGGRVTRLFNLEENPTEDEAADLSTTCPEIVERMRTQLEKWQRSVERSLSGMDY